MSVKPVSSATYEVISEYDRKAYEALTDVSWKMFREHFVHTRTYPFLSALCLVIGASLIAFWKKYSLAVVILHIAAIAFFLLAMPLSTLIGKRRICKKAIRQASAFGQFPFTIRFFFKEESIQVKLPDDRITDTPYRQITDMVAYGSWLFLFIGDRAYILNQNSFKEEEYRNFERFIVGKTQRKIWEIDPASDRSILSGI